MVFLSFAVVWQHKKHVTILSITVPTVSKRYIFMNKNIMFYSYTFYRVMITNFLSNTERFGISVIKFGSIPSLVLQ